MKQKTIYSTSIISILLLSTCLSFDNVADNSSQKTYSKSVSSDKMDSSFYQTASSETVSPAQKLSNSIYTGDGGKGIVIAVPAPVMQNGTAKDNWMPQLFQDLITGDLARFSAMTVLDRLNEQMVIAEQNLSISGNYSDNDFIRIGNLTNAKFIVAGRIQNISEQYNVSFRINNTETNEIKASFSKPYSINDIETGFAAKEAVKVLLAGMGIELTEVGEKSLLSITQVHVQSRTQLAKGVSAERSGNVVEALDFFTKAVESDPHMKEAETRAQNLFAVSVGASIRERANYAQVQADKWKKIFADLETYLDKNYCLVAVYDSSLIEDKINMNRQTVTITVKPGIKTVPNATALTVWKKVLDEWNQIKDMEENKIWASTTQMRDLYRANFNLNYFFGDEQIWLYDEHNHRIKKAFTSLTSMAFSYGSLRPKTQYKYYEDRKFSEITFRDIPLKDITDTLIPKVEKLYIKGRSGLNPIPIMSVAEWEQWLNEQSK